MSLHDSLLSERGQGQILLVDDEASVRKVGQAILQRLGYSVLTAGDGCEAVALVREHGEELTGIILDFTMPRMGGETALREILAISPRARVILASGYMESELSKRFNGSGLAGFLQKPFSMASLRDTLRRVL